MNTRTFFFCWTIDCESTRAETRDTLLGERAMRGFASILEEEGWLGTFFLTPEEVLALPAVVFSLAEKGHEIALHPHPDASGWPSPYLGTYSPDHQGQIVADGIAAIERSVGIRPVSCRPGYASANDSTFGVLAANGIRQTSASMPGRCMTTLASDWVGAPLFPHYAHAYNRLLTGKLDLVELPISVDWETMIWGGRHPQDLRVEFTDAKNQSFVIEKVMKRQLAEDLPVKSVVAFTHNIFRYDDPRDFRQETMQGMIRTMKSCATGLGLTCSGCTIAETAAAFRSAVPPAKEA